MEGRWSLVVVELGRGVLAVVYVGGDGSVDGIDRLSGSRLSALLLTLAGWLVSGDTDAKARIKTPTRLSGRVRNYPT
jgi:hypothetical protein